MFFSANIASTMSRVRNRRRGNEKAGRYTDQDGYKTNARVPDSREATSTTWLKYGLQRGVGVSILADAIKKRWPDTDRCKSRALEIVEGLMEHDSPHIRLSAIRLLSEMERANQWDDIEANRLPPTVNHMQFLSAPPPIDHEYLEWKRRQCIEQDRGKSTSLIAQQSSTTPKLPPPPESTTTSSTTSQGPPPPPEKSTTEGSTTSTTYRSTTPPPKVPPPPALPEAGADRPIQPPAGSVAS